MPLRPGTRLGHYEILSLAGAGAMGEVYRARDPRLQRDVALKILPAAFAADPERVRRFQQEVRVTGQLNHPNLLLVHDVGLEDGTPYLVSEILEGETLRERLKGGPLPSAKAIPLAIQILRGLAAAHARGIVHRDLKPENLFLLRDGRAKILDFGIAKLTQPEHGAIAGTTVPTQTSSHDAGTDPNVVIGTLGYMSPEQVRGLPTDHRSDLFSFGAVLYEMLTGRRAFQGKTPADTVTAILREEPSEMTMGQDPIPKTLDRIVRHCLEKEPEERFQSASDVVFALETLSTDPRESKSSEPAKGRSPLRWLVPILLCLVFLAAGIWIGRRAAGPASQMILSSQKLTYQRGLVTAAEFGSDDHTIFYSAEWDGRPSEIFSSDTKNPGSQRSILTNARLLAVSSSNELAVLIDYTGMAHGFARGTLATMPASGGSPRKVVENVLQADWSPDGRELAIARRVRAQPQLEYPIGRALYVSTGWITHVRVSPDGDHVAFLDHPIYPDDRGAVVIVDRQGKARTLTETWGTAQGLAWSADGKEVWFTAARTGVTRSLYSVDRNGRIREHGTQAASVMLMDISRTGSALLSSTRSWAGFRSGTRGSPEERELTWLDWSIPQDMSPDHRIVLFSEQGIGGGDHYSVCVRGTDGSPPIRLGEGSGGSLSPDGTWAMVIRFWESPPQLQLLPVEAGEPRTLPPTGLENIAGALYFPDGERILIVGNERGRGLRVYVRRLEGGPLTPITPEGVGTVALARVPVSPDGKWVVGVSPGHGLSLYPVDGGAPRPLVGSLPNEVPVGWSRDSKAVYVSQPRGTNYPWKPYRIDVQTGTRSLYLESQGPPDQAGVQMGVTFMGSDERTYVTSYGRRLDDLYAVEGLR